MRVIKEWLKKWRRVDRLQEKKQKFTNNINTLLTTVFEGKEVEDTVELINEFNKRINQEFEKKLKRINEEKEVIEKYLKNE